MSTVAHQPRQMLVTGGAGFIGSNFIRLLLADDPSVSIVNLDLLSYAGSRENLRDLPDESRHRLVEGDIGDRGLVADLLAEHHIDTVVNFAAESHVDRSIAGPEAFVRTNVQGTFCLLEACRRAWSESGGFAGRRFHQISTDEVYGTLGPGDPAFTESTPFAPNSPYAASKAGADHLARAYHHTYGLPVVTTHCSNNFGPYQHQEKLIPTVIRACLEGLPIPVYGDGSNIRDWLYVDDHCRGIDRVLRYAAGGTAYNLGGDNEQSNIALVRRICGVMDELRPERAPHADLIEFVTDRLGHDWRYAINSEAVRADLGWRERSDFEAALAATVRWYFSLWQGI